MSAITLQPKRTWLLMRNDLMVARTPAILLAAASGVILVLYVATSLGGGSQEFHEIAYSALLVLPGLVISSYAFAQIHDSRSGVYELSGPGSILEKYVTKVLLTSVGWAVAATLVYMLTTALGAAISSVVIGHSHGVFVPNSGMYWETFASYLIYQSVFVFGSIYFKKSAFLKPVLSVVILMLVYAAFLVVAGRIIYWNMFERLLPTEEEMNAIIEAISPHAERLTKLSDGIFVYVEWVVMPIFFWFVGYTRLRETEV